MRAVALAILFLLLSGCASKGSDPSAPSVDIVDIHGIALDPTDASILHVATHRGLVRIDEDGTRAYVGEARDDYMGFTAHPRDPKTFWASGHPRTGGNLGVIRTTDGGATWTRIGLADADLHAMAVSPADPERLYGFWRGQVLRSDDGGARWSPQAAITVAGFGPHPTDRDVVYAASGNSLQQSVDGGTTWAILAPMPALGVAVDPTSPSTLYVGTRDDVRISDDAGATWRSVTMPGGGGAAYFATRAATPGLVYAASYQKGIYRSEDGGATWDVVLAPPE